MEKVLGRDFIFWEPYGGLGDALAYSNLPELSQNQSGSSFYLSTLYKPRNDEILELVWGQNPFVTGWAKGPAKLGFLKGYRPTADGNFISDLELSNGFQPENKRPKVFYPPSLVSGFTETFLVDLSSVTVSRGKFALPSEVLEQEILRLGEKYVFVLPKRLYRAVTEFFPSALIRDNVVEVTNLFEYCDLLASSKGLLGVQSGAISLGVAMLEYNPNLQLISLMHPDLMASKAVKVMRNHIFGDVTYRVPAALS